MNIRKITLLTLLTAFVLTSCSKDNDDNIPPPLGDYENGLFVLHEGNFGQGNASVSFVSNDFVAIEHSVFSNVNNTLIGDTAQSMAFNGDTAYIVVNVSNTIEVVNRYTFESIATIDSGLSNPRYIAFANGKGYITNWGDGSNPDDDYVAVLDLNSNTLEAPIPVAEGPERLVSNGSNVYVAHQGGFSQNNIVSVINAASNSVLTTINVGDVPNSMDIDSSGNVWILSGGKPAWTGDETAGKLIKFAPANDQITTFDFGLTEHPNYFNMDGSSEFSGESFYDMTVKDGFLYGVDAADFASEGLLKIYDLNSNTETQSITVGIVPGGVYFN